jgi:phospholipid transport system substrate-binding protein
MPNPRVLTPKPTLTPFATLWLCVCLFLSLGLLFAPAARAAKKGAPKHAVAESDKPPAPAKSDGTPNDSTKDATKSSGPSAATADPPPASASPLAELKRSNAQLDKVLQKNRPNWSPEAELQRAEVRKLVGSFLDYGELGRRALARHWDGLTPRQREEFVSTLRELVERSYLKQVHGSPNYNIKYEKEAKNGSEATVDATLHTISRGKKVEIALEYKTLWRDGHWVVYDVVTDEQSMLENYRAEFNKIINKDGFDALLKKMKKKLEEKDE